MANSPVLVTGASGFLGRDVVRLLMERQQSVIATYRAPCAEADSLRKAFPNLFESLFVDFRREFAGDLFANRQFRAVVHLASYVPPSRRVNPLTELASIHDGVLGVTMRLLEAIKDKTSHFILASSVTVYGASRSGVFKEDAYCQPTDLYGTFKLACEGVCRCWAESSKMCFAALRFTQLYGPGEPHGLFLQRVFIPQAQTGGSIALIHGGREEKDLLWSADAAEAVVKAIESRVNGTFNIASGQGVSIRRISELIRELSSKEFPIEISDDGQPSLSKVFDSRRARETFGWEPRVDIKEGLRRLLQS